MRRAAWLTTEPGSDPAGFGRFTLQIGAMSKKRRLKHKKSNHVNTSKTHLFQRFSGLHLYAREVLILGILVAGVVLIYSNTLQHPFIFDDLSNIKHNAHIRLTELT